MLSLRRGVQWCDIGWQTQAHIRRKEQGVWIEETRGEREEELTVKAIGVSQLPLSRSLSELPCLFILSPTPSVTCLLIYSELILQLFCVRTRRCHSGYDLERTNGEKRRKTGVVVHARLRPCRLGGRRFWSLDSIHNKVIFQKTKGNTKRKEEKRKELGGEK